MYIIMGLREARSAYNRDDEKERVRTRDVCVQHVLAHSTGLFNGKWSQLQFLPPKGRRWLLEQIPWPLMSLIFHEIFRYYNIEKDKFVDEWFETVNLKREKF